MNLAHGLAQLHESSRPVRVVLIGAGKFGAMFLTQARRTPGVVVVSVVDLAVDQARSRLRDLGYDEEDLRVQSLSAASQYGGVYVTDDPGEVLRTGEVDVVIEATGDPLAGVEHSLACTAAGINHIMVNVEADALAGPELARRASAAGVVYSLAYGDQPAIICDLVDWARASGFRVVCAGKGTKYLPDYRESTPDTVWQLYGIEEEYATRYGLNPYLYNAFLDGTKSAIEMAAVANACRLRPPPQGLLFPPLSVEEIPGSLIPLSDGGLLAGGQSVEVISCLQRDGSSIPHDLRWGVYVVIEAPNSFVSDCFQEYGLPTDPSGKYAALTRPHHFIGLELGISVATVGLRNEATGAPSEFSADVVAIARKDLDPGDVLDGEGGFTVRGELMPAQTSRDLGALPVGLARGGRMSEAVPKGTVIRWRDIAIEDSAAVEVRRSQERLF